MDSFVRADSTNLPKLSNIMILEYMASSDKHNVAEIRGAKVIISGLKLSFLRLCRLMHITMLLTLVYFCNVCLWFIMTKKGSPRSLRYRFRVTIPSSLN